METDSKLVLIEWVDAHSGRGWQPIERIAQANEPLYCLSVGWLVSETRDCKVLVPHLGGDKNGRVILLGCGDLTIPTSSIVRMNILRQRR